MLTMREFVQEVVGGLLKARIRRGSRRSEGPEIDILAHGDAVRISKANDKASVVVDSDTFVV